MKVATQMESGHYLVGELIGHAPGKEWNDRSGNKRQPYEVKLLVGQSVLSIQYRSLADAESVLGKAPAARAQITARVFIRVVTAKGGQSPWISYAGVARPQAA
jgi:hypothetical protein